MKTKIVISAPNCVTGGILFITKDLLKELVKFEEFEIIAIVHSKELYTEKEYNNVKFLEFKDSKSSWFKRLKYEYLEFKELSKELKPDIWLSMHDITPNVEAKFLATYCHNSNMFHKFKFKEFSYDKKFGLFVLFYKYLYKINIKKNDFVFVQQEWIQKKFEKTFGINNVVVSKPKQEISIEKNQDIEKFDNFTFFYPSFPRCFKNFELICEAFELLESQGFNKEYKVYLTIDGSENKYSSDIVEKYSHLKNIVFLGLLPRQEVFEYYRKCDVLIFPSKLETWGLPISEFKELNKPMIVANCEYSKETVGVYEKVNFFYPEDANKLSQHMKNHVEKTIVYKGSNYNSDSGLVGWNEFINFVKTEYNKKIS